jgi:acetylornithine/succinyldiaminopimelate/putrescine aminotransferase/predicted amino acid dehydrogenase
MQPALNPTIKRLLALFGMDRHWVRGEGFWLFDAHGRRFFDGYAQYGALALGHNAPEVLGAVQAALHSGEPAMVQPYRAPYAEALAEALIAAAPGNLAHCIFANSGAEVVEAALKLVRTRTGRPLVLSTERSFHGKTMGALAATGQRQYAEGCGPEPPGFERVPFGDADALAQRLDEDGERVAAFLVEPIQGEAGVVLPPPDYLQRVRALCTRHGVALVLDEIQTGLGRTGRLFACEHDAVAPDLLLVAKALGGGLFPLGACLVSSAFWDHRFGLRHSSTFANNNVACRVGLAVLEALRARALPAAAQRHGARLLEGLRELQARHPRVLRAVRGRGLMTALELRAYGPDDGAFLSFVRYQGFQAYAVAATLAEQAGLLVLPALGDSQVLRVAPPLIVDEAAIEFILLALEQVLARLERNAPAGILHAIGAFRPRDDAPRSEDTHAGLLLTSPSALPARPDYAFLVHYTRPEDVVITDPDLAVLSEEERRRYCAFAASLPPGVMLPAPPLRSATGALAHGVIIAVPLLPDEMARRGVRRVLPELRAAVDLAATLGARRVGLGGYTVPYSRRGVGVLGRGPAITTGNALTAGVAFEAATSLLAARRRRPSDVRIAVVGARGSVGALCARLSARARPRALVLVGNPASGSAHLERLAAELHTDGLPIDVTLELECLADCELIFSATGAGRPVLDDLRLAPGTIVCDVARPPDTSPALRARRDITVIDGGLVRLPDARLRFGVGNLQGLPDGVQLACLAETILLALEGDTRDRGIGDDVPLSEVDASLALAARHGFGLAPPSFDGVPVEPWAALSRVAGAS